VTKLNPGGSQLLYSTYLGGSGVDEGFGIAVDNQRDAYVMGVTGSGDFPTVNAVQPTFGGFSDAFVTKLNPGGSQLLYSTYLGGSGFDLGFGIAVDNQRDAYVTGVTGVTGGTGSADFPTVNAVQPTFGGLNDAFVARLSPRLCCKLCSGM